MNQSNAGPERASKPSEVEGSPPSGSAGEWRPPTPTHAPWERWLSRTAEGFASVGAEAVHAAMLKTLRPHAVYAAFAREGAKVEGPADIASLDPAIVERVAKRVRMKYLALAATGGVGTGMFGLVGWVAEVPFIAALSLRAASELAMVYGVDASAPAEGRRMRKIISDLRLTPGGDGPSTGELASLSVSAAQNYYQNGAVAGLSLPVAKRAFRVLAERWGARRVARLLPWVGGAAGAAMGAWYVSRVLNAVGEYYRTPRPTDGESPK
jgi:EcsC protein family